MNCHDCGLIFTPTKYTMFHYHEYIDERQIHWDITTGTCHKCTLAIGFERIQSRAQDAQIPRVFGNRTLSQCPKHCDSLSPIGCPKEHPHPLERMINRKDTLCRYPTCMKDKQTDSYCHEHTEAMRFRCRMPWCHNMIDHDRWGAQHNFCEQHKCRDVSKTKHGDIECKSCAISGTSLCVVCSREKKFLTSLRFQLAEQVGRLACDTIFARM